MVGWPHPINGHELEQTPGDGEGQRSLACCTPRGREELDMTEQLNSNRKANPVFCLSLGSKQLKRRNLKSKHNFLFEKALENLDKAITKYSLHDSKSSLSYFHWSLQITVKEEEGKRTTGSTFIPWDMIQQ